MSNRNFYWRKDWFESLSKISSADTDELWNDYKAYCEFQEKGIRKIAFKHLNTFIDSICREALKNRMLFVRWIMPLAHSSPNFGQLLPHPLIEKLIKPTIKESLGLHPSDPDLLFWRGHLLRDYESLHQAIHSDPHHIASRSLLIEWKLGIVDYTSFA